MSLSCLGFYLNFFAEISNRHIRLITLSLIGIAISINCSGTSTADLMNGNFVNALNDTTPPNILTPKDGEVLGLKAVFQWTAKSGAKTYTIDVAGDSSAL